MSKIVILGHGDFHAKPAKGPGEVLIPPKTTLQFYTNAGQSLVLPMIVDPEDYQLVADAWSQLTSAETGHGAGPLEERRATYNFRLQPDDDEDHRTGARNAKFGGDVQVYFIDASIGETFLCTGTEETCPTPGLRVAAIRGKQLMDMGEPAVTKFRTWVSEGAVGDIPVAIGTEKLTPEEVSWTNKKLFYDYVAALEVPPRRWNHDCQGLLSKYAGHDLHWVACTAFDTAKIDEFRESVADMTVLDTSAASGPGAEEALFDPDADEDTLKLMFRERNTENMENMSVRQERVAVVATPKIVLIGPDHNRGPAEWVRSQADNEDGMIKMVKVFKKFEVTGIEKESNQDQVNAAIKVADPVHDDWKVEFVTKAGKRVL